MPTKEPVQQAFEPFFSRTKVTPPAGSQFEVQRQATLAHIGASKHTVVLMQAPAGFGKTTLMRQLYAAARNRGEVVAWLTMDASDNDVARFLDGFAAAMESINVEVPLPRPARNADFALWITDQIAAVTRPFTIFIDDVEALHDPTVVQVMRNGFDFIRSPVRLIVGARSVPDLGLDRLRAKGALLEVGVNWLRFSEQETREFLGRRSSQAMSERDVARLQGRTEGWAAALWLASLTLERHSDPASFVANFSGSHADIAAYLADDVLRRLDDDLRGFVVRCGVLDELSPALCDAVCGIGNSREILRELERRNLFIQSTDDHGDTYRFHGLFRDVLVNQLHRRHLAELPSLHRAASAAYLKMGRPIPAIRHALRSGDMEHALDLLDRHVGWLIEQGRMRLVGEWLDQLPRAELVKRPNLKLICAWCVAFNRSPGEALELIADIDLDALPPDSASYLLALRPMLWSMTDQIEEAHRVGSEALQRIPATAHFARSMLYQALAQASVVLGLHDEGRRFIDQAEAAQRHSKSVFGTELAESVRALHLLMGGHLKEAMACLTPANSPHKGALIGNAVSFVQLAEMLYEGNQCDAAERLLLFNAPIAQEHGLPDVLITVHVTQARIADARGDYGKALDALSELENRGYRFRLPRVVASARLELSRLYLQRGNFAEANSQIAQAEKMLDWTSVAPRWFFANDTLTPDIARARYLICTGEAGAAAELIHTQLESAEDVGRYRRALKLRILMAMALYAQNHHRSALRTLERAKSEADARGFVRSFFEEGVLVETMLRELSTQGRTSGADADKAGPGDKALEKGAANRIVLTMGDPLSKKEIQALQLLAQGYTNAQVADSMFVSDSTVRTHLRHINSKLQTRNRIQAVAVAQRLRLI